VLACFERCGCLGQFNKRLSKLEQRLSVVPWHPVRKLVLSRVFASMVFAISDLTISECFSKKHEGAAGKGT